MKFSLQIKSKDEMSLEIDSEGNFLVPTNEAERNLCLKALSDAFSIISDATPLSGTCAKEFVTYANEIQNSLSPGGFHVVSRCSHPTEQQEGNSKHKLRLVSARLPLKYY